MRPGTRALALVGLLVATSAARADLDAPAWPHRKPARAGVHPRLFLGPDEVEAARRKVNAPGTLSSHLWAHALAAAPTEAAVPAFWPALHATAPFAALLAATEEERTRWGRVAIESALAVTRSLEPPYPEPEEWWGRYLYRYLALAYDGAYASATPDERAELADEMLRIGASIGGPERSPNNHSLVFGIDLGLIAMALDGDVAETVRTVADEPVVRAGTYAGGDWLAFRSSIEVDRVGVAPGGADFAAGKDYAVRWFRDDKAPHQQGFGIAWLPGGKAPAAGTTYHVSYRFQPELAAWQDAARAAVQRNLDTVWSDGASLAGVMYGGWTASWLVDAFEAMRRNLDVDFARHPDARDFVRWLPTELVPSDGPSLRAHNRNDSGYDQMDNRARFGAPLAWASTRLRDDPGRRDLAAAWLASRSTAWIEWAGPREALWARDDLLSAPPFRSPAPLDLPPSAFFRGHGLSNFRTGAWDGPTDDWSLFALVGGPFVGPEHDQTDKGSFAFYACGEDFVVDSGYAQGDARSDATAAHSYLLLDGKGQPGPWGTTASVRATFLSDAFDATLVDLTRSWRNANGWGAPKDDRPDAWPVRSATRAGAQLERPGRAPVVVVADALDVDGKPHDVEWLLHTQAGNTLTVEGARASIVGARGKGRCDVHLVAAAPLTLRTGATAGVDFPEHPRLRAAARAPDPGFLAVLVPERAGEASPARVETDAGPGWRAATVRTGDLRDVVVAVTPGAVGKALGLETDARLAVVRTVGDGTPSAWLVLDATFLRAGARTLWQVERPKGARGSAAWDGTSLSAEGADVTALRAAATATTLRRGDVRLPTSPVPGGVTWSGRRPLQDTYPPGVPALAEDFASGCAPWFSQWPLQRPRGVRCVEGALCLPGLKHDWVSWTRRTYTPFRADVMTWPRTIYGDFVLRGTATFLAVKPGATWRVQAHVADRTYPEEWQPPDQDLLQVEVDPATGATTLSHRVDGKDAVLASAKAGPVPRGVPVPFEWSVQGGAVRFSWAGSPRLRHTTKGDLLPRAGYFQWEQAEGLHVHLDDLRVTVDP